MSTVEERQSADVFATGLSACDQEPIRTPGAIQPHGLLFVLEAARLNIEQVSENLRELLGIEPRALLGNDIAVLLGESGRAAVRDTLRHVAAEQAPFYMGRIMLRPGLGASAQPELDAQPGGAPFFDALLHRAGPSVILELETLEGHREGTRFDGAAAQASAPLSPDKEDIRTPRPPAVYSMVRSLVPQLQSARGVQDLAGLAVREIQGLTGFGRVLLYRFDEDGHGHVLAERCEAGYASFLNHHFPASDIPRQARELYRSQHLRLISDANCQPARLVPILNPVTGAATDLSFAALRSVSPIHLQYMRNMGTLASMSVSLMVRGELWGLISCHNHQASRVPFETRLACEHLGEIVSMQIEAKEANLEIEHRMRQHATMVKLIAAIADAPNIVEGLLGAPGLLLDFMASLGAAIVYDEQVTRLGQAPTEAEIRMLIEAIAARADSEVFASDSLARILPQASGYADRASGVLAIRISKLHRHFILWFRPEMVETIEWAGNPGRKGARIAHPDDASSAAGAAAGDAGAELSPRRSFATWRETVRGRSLRWRASEIHLAGEFRNAALGIALRRAEEMAALAIELSRANKELEAFSYSVSHDLRAPIRHIVGYGDLLRELEAAHLSERGNRYLDTITDSARLAGTLVDDLLTFSQMGRAALRLREVDLGALVQGVVRELQLESGGRRIEWRLPALPTVKADPAFLLLALRNLLSNAVKYTRPREQAVIEVFCEQNAHETIVSVRDNGVGFNMRYVGKLFGVFQRLHRSEDFEGTGIGLANVRRIIERHGGRAWAVGALDQGATFSFSLPKNAEAPDSFSSSLLPS